MYIQLKFLNNGMRHFDVLFVLPIYQAFWITGATINGILFFEEYNNFCPAQYYMFPIGCVLTVGGVAALALKYEQTAALDSLPLTPRSAAAAAVREGIDEGDEDEDEDESPGGLEDQLRKVQRKDLVLNDHAPKIEVDPHTYEVRADGQLLTCEPAKVLPMAQRYFLF